MTAAFHGVRVLDLSRVLAGPYCTQLLADHGADVIKVESPEGDENRVWGSNGSNGISCTFNSVNRGKRAITLNLKSKAGASILRALIERSDVVIHSFLPDAGARLGIDYPSVRKVKPDVVFCSITGYGERGPMRNSPGYDLMLQAFSGIMSTTGHADQAPVRVGPSCIDMATGVVAYGAISTALYRRKVTGEGGWVQASLLETGISLLGYHAVTWLQVGALPTKQGSGLAHLVPYQAFRCKDGYLLAGATNDAAWTRFCTALGRPEMASDERFQTNDKRLQNRNALLALLEADFAGRAVAEWIERFDANRVPVAPVQTLDEVLMHPQVVANGLVVRMNGGSGDLPLLRGPFQVAGADGVASRPPPQLGEHTEEVLRDDLRLAPAAIAELRSQGAI